MQRRLLVVGACVAFFVLILWFTLGRGRGALTAELPRPGAVVEPSSHSTVPAIPASTAPSVPEVSRESMPIVDVATPPSPEHEARTKLRLSGTVVLVDWNGVELGAADGVFQLAARDGDFGIFRNVRVTRGEWTTQLEVESTPVLSVESFRTATGEFVLENAEALRSFVFPIDGRLELRARQLRPSMLSVVDARDGSSLREVELVRAGREATRHPGAYAEADRIASHLTSPIDLSSEVSQEEPREARFELFVGAENYAWQRMEVNFLTGGEQEVRLERGAELHVELVGVDPRSAAQLCLRETRESKPFLATDADDSEMTFRGLPPGPWVVLVEIGPWQNTPIELGSVEVELVAGEAVHAKIVAQPAPEYLTAPASGLLILPSAWEIERPVVAARFVGISLGGGKSIRQATVKASNELREGFVVHEWSFDSLEVGRHEWLLLKPSFNTSLEVPPQGLAGHQIVIPPPTELLVRILDSRTGLDVETDALRWFPQRPGEGGGGPLGSSVRDANTGRYRILAPAILIQLSVWDWRYMPKRESVDLSAGVAEHTLRVDPAPALEIVLKDGEAVVEFPEQCDARPEPAPNNAGEVTVSRFDRPVLRFQLSAAGLWTFQAPTIPGYRTPDLATIDVRAGEVTVHEIQLVPERP